MHLCGQGDGRNGSHELGTRRGILYKHTLSTTTEQAVSQKKQAVRAKVAVGTAEGASGLGREAEEVRLWI